MTFYIDTSDRKEMRIEAQTTFNFEKHSALRNQQRVHLCVDSTRATEAWRETTRKEKEKNTEPEVEQGRNTQEQSPAITPLGDDVAASIFSIRPKPKR
jgi:hypothetical protein